MWTQNPNVSIFNTDINLHVAFEFAKTQVLMFHTAPNFEIPRYMMKDSGIFYKLTSCWRRTVSPNVTIFDTNTSLEVLYECVKTQVLISHTAPNFEISRLAILHPTDHPTSKCFKITFFGFKLLLHHLFMFYPVIALFQTSLSS